MKIGIFSGYFPPHMGGVERYTAKLSAALSGLGYEIVVVTFNESGLSSYEQAEAYSVYRLPVLGALKERYPIPKITGEYKALLRKVENEKIDFFIVNTRFHLTSLIGAKMGKRAGKPVLLIEHGTDHFTVGNKFFDFFGLIYEHALTHYLKRFVDRFYGVSKSCNAWLKHFSITTSGVFYNAIDAGDKKRVQDFYRHTYPEDEIVITFAGRLIKAKGILNLLDAFARIKQENKAAKLRLVIAGDGELLETIKKDYQDPAIDVLGKLNFEHVMSLFKRTDIFVHPSLYPEGLPTAILEAGLMGCAIVATPRGGTEEVIPDHKHGKIVEGSVGSLHAAISGLIASPADEKACAAAVQRRIESNFEWNVVAKVVDKELKALQGVHG